MVLIYFLFYLLFICKPEWKFKLFIELEAEIDQTQSNMGLFWLVMYSEMKSVHLYTLILRVNLCNLMLVSFFKLINRFRTSHLLPFYFNLNKIAKERMA